MSSAHSPWTREEGEPLPHIRIGKYRLNLPESRWARIGIGVALVFYGLLGFLPVLGFWMIPAGFIVLATAIPAVRRFNRRVAVTVKSWWSGRKPRTRSSQA
jgi:hypothetical protein